jgi:hypothetical protein
MNESPKKQRKDFTLTLLQSHIKDMEFMKQYTLPEACEYLYFRYESEPNLSCGDIIRVKVPIDDTSKVEFDAEILDIVPPLKLPPNDSNLDVHISLLSKYLKPEIVQKLRAYYLSGKAERQEWTVYFKSCRKVIP